MIYFLWVIFANRRPLFDHDSMKFPVSTEHTIISRQSKTRGNYYPHPASRADVCCSSVQWPATWYHPTSLRTLHLFLVTCILISRCTLLSIVIQIVIDFGLALHAWPSRSPSKKDNCSYFKRLHRIVAKHCLYIGLRTCTRVARGPHR